MYPGLDDSVQAFFGADDAASGDLLPPEAQEYYGFYDAEGSRRDGAKILIDGKTYGNLSEANDKGVTLAKIGEYIRENWKHL